MAVCPEARSNKLLTYIAKLIDMQRLLNGVHFGASILSGIDQAVQWVEHSFNFINYLLHLYYPPLLGLRYKNCKHHTLLESYHMSRL